MGARYKLNDSWQISGLLQQTKDFSGGDRDAWGVGLSYNINAYDISTQYYRASKGDNANSDADMIAFGVSRTMDKALSLYTAMAFTNNSEAASFNIAAAGHGKRLTISPGADPFAVSVGAIYRF